jgi:hypothetical protein
MKHASTWGKKKKSPQVGPFTRSIAEKAYVMNHFSTNRQRRNKWKLRGMEIGTFTVHVSTGF